MVSVTFSGDLPRMNVGYDDFACLVAGNPSISSFNQSIKGTFRISSDFFGSVVFLCALR